MQKALLSKIMLLGGCALGGRLGFLSQFGFTLGETFSERFVFNRFAASESGLLSSVSTAGLPNMQGVLCGLIC